MTVEELENNINIKLKKELYSDMFKTVFDNADIVKDSNILSYFYYLCMLNRQDFENEGKLGILENKKSVREIVDIYLDFRRLIQRIAYCPEYNDFNITNSMKEYGININELIWTINSATFNSEETLNKIKGDLSMVSENTSTYVPKYRYQDVLLDFIICSNDVKELDEALFYISRLNVPDGVMINVLSIADAESICAGYNEALNASSAKYKVYMHQDVRIIERDFIPKLLDMFIEHEDVGIVGMIGSKEIPEDGIMWHMQRYGSVYDTHIHETSEVRFYSEERDVEVLLCDGLLLATQYDLPWREDIFDGWDFYDASQCMEFYRKGYKVLVPYQESSWCVHDCGFLNFNGYDKYRKIFLEEYN